MGEEKPEVLDAVLRETVDLVMDLTNLCFNHSLEKLGCPIFFLAVEVCVLKFHCVCVCICRKTSPLMRCLRI